ncbi:MAG TPA: ABC transporter ATP-binding protein [Actinomycetaceae bacterium]|nr:ABC transporter ATP-binding protein [Actinomycetaceae bacterium]
MSESRWSSEHGLVLDGVSVEFPRRGRDPAARVLHSVSLNVGLGEVVVLLGPSGSGKSTLLRAVAGLERLAGGDIRWDGQSVVNVPVHLREFGLMFQDGQLFPHRDVAGNVAYGLTVGRAGSRAPGHHGASTAVRGGEASGHETAGQDADRPATKSLTREEQEVRVSELLELVGLPGFEGRSVTTLSGGERQRVALARSLAPAPRLLMLDEPLSALDRTLRERLTGEVARILRVAGMTSLYVTHDHGEARAVADRVGIILDGELVQVATSDELWSAPANGAVAEFLGV